MKEEKKEGEGDEKEGEEKEKEKEASEGSEAVKNTNSTWGVITVESGMELTPRLTGCLVSSRTWDGMIMIWALHILIS